MPAELRMASLKLIFLWVPLVFVLFLIYWAKPFQKTAEPWWPRQLMDPSAGRLSCSTEGVCNYFHSDRWSMRGEDMILNSGAWRFLKDFMESPSLEESAQQQSYWPHDDGRLLPRLVTAADPRFYQQLMTNMADNFRRFPDSLNLTIFDLSRPGDVQFTEEHREAILALGGGGRVELRNFTEETAGLPSHVQADFSTYAFKVVAVALALKDYGAVAWIDTSVILKRNLTNEVMDWVGPTGAVDNAFPAPGSPKLGSCFFYILPQAGHSTYCATAAETELFLPPQNVELLAERQYQGGGFVMYNTDACKRHIVEPALACSLHLNCIGTRGPKPDDRIRLKYCHGPIKKQRKVFSRQDQAVWHLLARNSLLQNETFLPKSEVGRVNYFRKPKPAQQFLSRCTSRLGVSNQTEHEHALRGMRL